MAKKAYIGVNNIARKVKKVYIGVGGTARKVKKVYVGVNGVARPCWGLGELSYYGTITPLSEARDSLASSYDINYALFGAGKVNPFASTANNVDAYDKSLVKTNPNPFTIYRTKYAGASVGGNYLFGGGEDSSGDNLVSIEGYNSSLIKTTVQSMLTGIDVVGGISSDNKAFLGGGSYKSVNIYNSSLVRTNPSDLIYVHGSTTSKNSNYVFFMGSNVSSNVNSNVEVYNIATLVRSTATSLSGDAQYSLGAYVGDYALASSQSTGNIMQAYDNNFLQTTITAPTVFHRNGASCSMSGYAIFAGGDYGSSLGDAYDENLVHSNIIGYTQDRTYSAGASVGDYGLFAGGLNPTPNTSMNMVDAYTLV